MGQEKPYKAEIQKTSFFFGTSCMLYAALEPKVKHTAQNKIRQQYMHYYRIVETLINAEKYKIIHL